jgi:crossover junction endodeoxyribonuclease RusA
VSYFVILPLPPSVNAYWRSVPATRNRRARVLISEAGRAFKDAARLAAAAQCRVPLSGDVRLSGVVYFQNKRRDLDNVFKPLLDALQGWAYINDSQVAHIDFRRAIDCHRPRVELTISRVDDE